MAPTHLAPAPAAAGELATFLQTLSSPARPAVQSPSEAVPIPPISPAQKMEIQRLAAHPLLSRPEKTKVLLAYYRYDSDQAADAIRRLQKLCSDLDDMRAAV